MKKLLLSLTLLSSLSALAGDLALNCYLGQDQGNSLQISGPYMEKNKSSVQFTHEETSYTVLVSRTGLFSTYKYEIIKINLKDDSFTKSIKANVEYGAPITLDRKVSCIITD